MKIFAFSLQQRNFQSCTQNINFFHVYIQMGLAWEDPKLLGPFFLYNNEGMTKGIR